MRHLQTHLSRAFGGCGKARKAQPSEYRVYWPDGTMTKLAKVGGVWSVAVPAGQRYSNHYLSTSKECIAALGGKIEKDTKWEI